MRLDAEELVPGDVIVLEAGDRVPADGRMATFHSWQDDRGRDVVRCFVKGAPDVLAGRADRYLGGEEILAVRRRRPQEPR